MIAQRVAAVIVLLICLTQFYARGIDSLEQKSPVWDETMHMDYGYAFTKHGPTFSAADHPYPITALLTLPVVLRGAVLDEGGFLVPDSPENLWAAREANLWLSMIAILLIAALVARLYGLQVGLFTLCLGSLDPSWLAHSRLVTTDIAFGAGFFLSALCLQCFGQTHQKKWLVFGGLSIGMASTAKFSSLLLPFLFCGAFFVHQWRKRAGNVTEVAKQALVPGAIAGFTAFIFLAIVFEVHWTLGKNDFLAGPSHWLEGLVRFTEIRAEGRGSMLLGEFSSTGFLAFFPILLLSKTPLISILLVIFGAFYLFLRDTESRIDIVLPMTMAFLLASIFSFVNLGYRHLSPVFPLLWLLGAFGMLWVQEQIQNAPFVMWALPFALLVEGLGGHPHYLPWTNQLVGGVDSAHEIAVDSSTDWGQDLPAVSQYLEQNEINQPPDFAYFGTANPLHYGIRTYWRPCGLLGRPPLPGQPRKSCAPDDNLLLISASCLEGVTGTREKGLRGQDNCYEWLRARKPDAILGGSILVFHPEP